jgi:hypothetical protein
MRIKVVAILIIGLLALGGFALTWQAQAQEPEPFYSHYWITGMVSQEGSPAATREVQFYLTTDNMITTETDASGNYEFNIYELEYFHDTPITYETVSYTLKVPTTESSNWSSEESFVLTTSEGYMTMNLDLQEELAGLTVTVMTPNGGETWEAGTWQNITWGTAGSPESINLYYSIDDGGSYSTIATNEPDDGVYEWFVPDDPTTEARIRIEAVSGSEIATDESNTVFTIRPATVFYVDATNGDNAYSGLTTEVFSQSGIDHGPWQNLSYSATQSASGDMICLRAGTYNAAAGEDFPVALSGQHLLGESSAAVIIEGSADRLITLSSVSTIEGCNVRSTSPAAGASVVSAESGASVTVRNNRIGFAGSPPANSRGVYINNSTALISYNLISNVAVGVRAEKGGSTTTVESDTIVKFSGRGVENIGDTCYINNTIISSSPEGTAVSGSYGVYSENGTTECSYNDVYLNETNYYHTGTGGLTNAGAITREAQFASVSGSDYHLRYNSPCIDAGDPASSPDPDGSRADMGMYPFDQTT